MGKIKNYDRSLYKDIYDAIHTLMNEEMSFCAKSNGYVRVYSKEAFDTALSFLCVNDIPHSYTIKPLNVLELAGINSIISIRWLEEGMERSCVFFCTVCVGEDRDEM